MRIYNEIEDEEQLPLFYTLQVFYVDPFFALHLILLMVHCYDCIQLLNWHFGLGCLADIFGFCGGIFSLVGLGEVWWFLFCVLLFLKCTSENR